MRKNNRKGFTIVELVIVIAVIAILAGVLIPTFAGVVSKANASKALQEAQNAIKVVAAEYAEKGEAMPNATVYYLDKDASAADAKVEYTVAFANGVAGAAVDAKGVDFTYTSGDCYAKTAIVVKEAETATDAEGNTVTAPAVNTTVVADLAKNIIVVVDAD
mgnify:CR=1 FL=1